MVSLCRVSFFVHPIVSFLLIVFLFCFSCFFFPKFESFGLGLSSSFFVFCSIVLGLESGLQKNKVSSFNLVLIWFGYRGFFFLIHNIRLWFVVLVSCVV